MTTAAYAYQRDYIVKNQELTPGVKISLDLIVSGKPSSLELEQLASTIRHQLCRIARIPRHCEKIYPRVFLTWYLTGMKIGGGAWATTHFDPELEIKIMDWMLEYNPPVISKQE